jgi:uncharacterized protein
MAKFAFDRLACGAALALLAAGAAQATVKDGVDAWQAGNFPKAIAEWRGPADAGDADAQFNLAQAYKLGRGVPADMGQAQALYEKAARQGHEQAQANLGLILFQKGERAAAMPWLLKAADRGEPRAQYVVGTAHFNGDLAAKDWPRAYALMTRAAASGLPQAGKSLVEMDKYIPLGQRQQGMAIARELAAAETAADAAAPPPAAAPTRVASATPAVRPVPLPPAKTPPPPRPQSASAPASPPPPRPAPPPPAPKPAAAPAPKPAAASAAGGGWRVQLGAFGTQGAAEGAWGGFRSLAGFGGLRPSYAKAGAVTRLQAGPLADKAAATRACAAAKSAGKDCFPVAP